MKNFVKKSLCALMSFAMFAACFQFSQTAALANTKRTAQSITLDTSVSAYIDSADNEYWISFEPSASGYYEFVCSPVNSSGMILGSIYDASEDILMMNACTPDNSDFVTAAELEAGETYYFVLETSDGTAYSATVSVRTHTHTYTTTQNYTAIYDANDTLNNSDGGSYTFCAYCSDYITNATYYYPASIKLSKTKYTYNGKKKTPSVTVKDRTGKVISSSNYKVTYKNNKKPGTATVTVKFKGNYSGTMTATFKIIPKKATVKSVKSSSKKKLKVTWKKDSTVSGYQVQYSTSKKFTSKKTKSKLVKKVKTTSLTVKKLKSGKKYYVRVRSYKTINGKKVYGAWSKVKSVKVK